MEAANVRDMGIPATEQPSGFWSYVHADEESERGRILRLCQLLEAEFSLLTGRQIEMFVDRKDIAWGDKWRETIDDALTETTFFIAIVTPRYVNSVECRKELLLFAQNAAVRRVPELLLPILYIPVEGLTSESPDEVRSAIAKAQYIPFDELRLEDETSSAYRRAINALARRLVDIANTVAERPEVPPMIPISPDSPAPSAASAGEPGFIDALAEMEEIFPQWQGTVERYAELMTQIGDLFTRYAPRMAKAAKKNAAARLFVAKELSQELDPLAEEFRVNGTDYAEQAVRMNENMVMIISQIGSRRPEDRKDQEISTFMNGIKELSEAGRASIESVHGFKDSANEVSALSRDIRGPLRKVSEGAQSFLDGQQLLDDWARRIKELEVADAGDPPQPPTPTDADGTEPRSTPPDPQA